MRFKAASGTTCYITFVAHDAFSILFCTGRCETHRTTNGAAVACESGVTIFSVTIFTHKVCLEERFQVANAPGWWQSTDGFNNCWLHAGSAFFLLIMSSFRMSSGSFSFTPSRGLRTTCTIYSNVLSVIIVTFHSPCQRICCWKTPKCQEWKRKNNHHYLHDCDRMCFLQ